MNQTFARALAHICTAGLVASGTPAAAQTEADKQFNRPVENSSCVSSGRPDYPFSVQRILRAIKTTEIEDEKEVQVAVFDNEFLGYRIDDQAADSREYPIMFVRNFPKEYFLRYGTRFIPYADPNRGLVRAENFEINPETGHGTSVVGIILGGKYEGAAEPVAEGKQNLVKPSARRLLLYDFKHAEASHNLKPWLRVAFVPVRYASSGHSDDPVTRLDQFFKSGAGRNFAVINMSFGQVVTDDGNDNFDFDQEVDGALIVAAAGNNKKELGRSLRAKPISATHKGIMLIVASHDADGKLSGFSNFGSGVTIAAPGCGIQSWLSGDSDAKPLNGTSMATAVVSYAAALVRSRWGNAPTNTGISLRNRLISSARFSEELSQCGFTDPGRECVKYGSMLDIEAALLLNRDFIEYETCDDQAGATRCTRHTAVGRIMRGPSFLGECLSNAVPEQLFFYNKEVGLTYDGSIKRIAPGSFRLFFEKGQKVGSYAIEQTVCQASAQPVQADLAFTPQGLQLDGSTAADGAINIPVNRLIRIVARAVPE